MTVLKAILREVFGLFIDDVGFAAAIVSWIILAWLLSGFILPSSPWVAILLFAGLGAILLESTLRRAGSARCPSDKPS